MLCLKVVKFTKDAKTKIQEINAEFKEKVT